MNGVNSFQKTLNVIKVSNLYKLEFRLFSYLVQNLKLVATFLIKTTRVSRRLCTSSIVNI